MRSVQLLTLVALLAACGDEAPLFYYPFGDTAPDIVEGDALESDTTEDAVESDSGDDIGALDATEDPASDTVSDVEPDANRDAQPDVTPDADPDTESDTEPDTEPDVLPDTEPDAEPDVVPDVLPDIAPDAEPDADPDVVPDVPSGCTPIAEIRASTLGFVEGRFCDVVVTYVSPFGFFVQEQRRTGPAINIFEAAIDWTNPEGIEVGDVLTFDVHETDEFRGMQQVIARSSSFRASRGFDVDSLTQSLSTSGALPAESNESERVSIDDGLVSSILGRDLMVEYGGVEALLRVANPGPFCVGLTFSMTGIVTENEPDGIHRIESWWDDDFELPPGACESDLPLAGADDLVINELLADPPDTGGDANCDGVRHPSHDEFIEIVNVSARDLSLAGFTISDEISMRHTFNSTSEIRAGEAIVVFGGGTLACDFRGTPVELASSGTLGFSNAGDTISLHAPDGVTTQSVTYTTSMTTDVSLVLSPEANTAGTYLRHNEAASDLSPYSAGYRADGAPF